VLNPLVLAAARRAGVSEIWRVGGAQAVAALAWGTAALAPVDRVVGPGNAYVAEGQAPGVRARRNRQHRRPVRGVVLADAANDPAHVADGPAGPGRA
jgi:histidinol dehydrogenase